MTIHFSNVGSDALPNNGSLSAPFRTVAKANSLLVAGLAAGEELAFRAGDVFDDAELLLSGLTGSAALPWRIRTYGSGRAKLRALTAGRHGLNLSSTQHVRVAGIDLDGPLGAAASNAAKAGINVAGCTDVQFDDVFITGFARGLQTSGANSGCALRQVFSSYAWHHGFEIGGTGVWTIEDVDASFAGYDLAFAENAAADSGFGFHLLTTSGLVIYKLRAVECLKWGVRGMHASGTDTILRAWISSTRIRQYGGVTQGAAGTIVLRDSIGRLASSTTLVGGGSKKLFGADNQTGRLHLDNVVGLSFDADTTGTKLLVWHNGHTVTFDNCAFYAHDAQKLAKIEVGAVTDPVGRQSGWFIRNMAPGFKPFVDNKNGTGERLFAQWKAAFDPGAIDDDPLLENPLVVGPDGARLLPGSPWIGGGLDLGADYSALPAPTDFFGAARATGVAYAQWSRGAYEYPTATVQSFREGGGAAELDGLTELDNYAVLLQTAPFPTFPAVDHSVEADVRFQFGMARVGVWGLGGRVGDGVRPLSLPLTLDPYEQEFATGAYQALEDGGRWDLGRTPGVEDARRIRFTVDYTAGAFSAVLSAEAPSLAPGVPAVTFAVSGVLPALVFEQTYRLRLELKYRGRQPGVVGSDYVFDLYGYVDGEQVVSALNMALPVAWIEGTAASTGPAVFAGLYGRRSTTGGAAASALVAWSSFTGRIDGDLSTLPVPAAIGGETRPKAYLAARRQARNLLANGGFTDFPREAVVQRLAGVVPTLDPSYTAVAQQRPVHFVFLVDASNSMTGAKSGRARRVCAKFISEGCPLDGSVIFTMVRHWGGDDLFGGQADEFVPSVVVTAETQAAILAQIALFDGISLEAWATGFLQVIATLNAGVQIEGQTVTGARKIVVALGDDTGYHTGGSGNSVGAVPAAAQAVLTQLHAVPGLVEVDCVFVEWDAADTLVGMAPVFFPTTPPPNTPRALPTPLGAEQAVPSTVVIPQLAGSLVLSTVSLWKPTTAATVPLAGNAAADQIGLDLGVLTFHWRDQYVATLPPAGPVPLSYRDAYEAWPPAVDSFGLEVTAEPTGQLGGWSLAGARGVVELAPVDGDVRLVSYDGGNLLRLRFADRGRIELTQRLRDPKPWRGRALTCAYSGRRFVGAVKVELLLRADGVEQLLDTAWSSSFDRYRRRVASGLLPLNARDVDVVVRLTGGVGDALGLSGLMLAPGRYDHQLPWAESHEQGVIPPGAVVFTTGAACPPGYRELPEQAGRLLLGLAGDPNFYTRSFSGGTTAAATAFDVDVDVVVVVDASVSQGGQGRNLLLAWLDELLRRRLPQTGRVRVAVVVTNALTPGYVLLGPTIVTSTTVVDLLGPAVTALAGGAPALGAGGDDLAAGFAAAQQLLEGGSARHRVLLYNTDASFDHADAALATAFAALTALPQFAEASAVVVNATLLQALAQNADQLVWPAPHDEAPGLLFAATGGPPGSAFLNAYYNQPYQAGAYAARLMGEAVERLARAALQETADLGVGATSRLGGQQYHEHATFAQPLDEPDGFEEPSGAVSLTRVPLPTRDTAVVKPYPFGFAPQQTRPEDPPALVVGAAHQHRLLSRMEALPPSFPVLWCEKL